MTRDKWALTALHLLLVWAAMTAAVPALGAGLFVSAWAGGAAGMVPAFAIGAPLTVGLLALTGTPAQTVVPLCTTVRRRFGWAVLVFALGTLGPLAGLAAYDAGVDLGSANTRVALTGASYAVAAAFFVPNRWVRLGAVAALAAAVAYGSFLGPAHAQQRRQAAAVARYREHPELLYLGAAPPGMQVSRAEVGPAYFSVSYRPVHPDVLAYADLNLRPLSTPGPQCPDLPEEETTCTVDEHGELRMIHDLPGGTRNITLIRRHQNAEAEVSSQTLDERALRDLLGSLHPLSDTDLRTLMRDKRITHVL
ncbi:hypothetical protein [Streptomyces sp. NBC_00211]|uniref:hypothetical protein n=1 Tax=Streptomyces sp. NBC_00211 TaxID=2975683 RepID=UPI0032555330